MTEPADLRIPGEAVNSWRIGNACHLKGATLHRRRYRRRNENWDHDHCAACWSKFAEFEGVGILREGYTTGADFSKGAEYDWVCATCFNELKYALGRRAADDGVV